MEEERDPKSSCGTYSRLQLQDVNSACVCNACQLEFANMTVPLHLDAIFDNRRRKGLAFVSRQLGKGSGSRLCSW